MSKPSWMWLSIGAVAMLGCTTHRTPNIDDANVSALLGAPAFAGKWHCRTDRSPGTHWYQLAARSCVADDSSGTTSTQVRTMIDHDGHVEIANRDWWIRDSTEWIARRDSLVRALLARFPEAAICHGPPAAFARPPRPVQPGVIRDRSAWRAHGYDVAISTLGMMTKTDPRGRLPYMLSLEVTKEPGWILECGTEAQWMKHSRPTAPRRSTDTARR